jgi:hypothetical protein
MNFNVANEWDDYTFGGSGLVGMINVSREFLVQTLGEPIAVNGDNIQERWLLRFDNGVVATIFSDRKTKADEWCVGGFGDYDKKTKENLSFRAVKELLHA